MKLKRFSFILASLLLTCNSSIVKASTIIDYSVKSGDSLWKISQTYNTTVDKISSLNSLTSANYIYIGQTLKVEDNRYTSYAVISGDTLWKISVKFNTTVDNIVKFNNLTSTTIYVGQVLRIPLVSTIQAPQVQTINYTIVSGDTVWGVAQKFNTSMDAIVKSNMLAEPIFMPGQIITVPVNSTQIVKPVGISMYKARVNNNFGDIYTWENGRRLFTVAEKGTLTDLNTGISFQMKYYGGSNHSDIVPLTFSDADKMKQIYPAWSWTAMKPMILTFTQGGTNYKIAVSVTGMPHSTTNMYNQNGINGHFDMYFYNSTSHVSNELSPTHQNNILKANGQ